jgi:hypothetical protein
MIERHLIWEKITLDKTTITFGTEGVALYQD